MTQIDRGLRAEAAIRGMLCDASASWSIGTFGAIAEFHRDPQEAVTAIEDELGFGMLTARGGIRVSRGVGLEPVAYLSPTTSGERWGGTVAFCLEAGAADIGGLPVIAALGPDRGALRLEDRAARLFNMGVGMRHIQACVRTSDPDLIAILEENAGRHPFADGMAAMSAILKASPPRVFVSKGGRVEVYQPIPPSDGVTPMGPHTHVLPKLIRTARAFSANAPIPDGLLPVLSLHPESPFLNADGSPKPGFDHRAAAGLDVLMAAFGLPEEVEALSRFAAQLGEPFSDGGTRRERMLGRVALRRAAANGARIHPSWRSALTTDNAHEQEDEDVAA